MIRLFGVIGCPVNHSLSPVMHAAAFQALRLDALYSAFEVPPRFLAPMLRALVLAGVEGLNVTVPLKETVLPLLDRLEPAAKAIGAVNTIVISNRRTVGYNTDGVGFRTALCALGWRFAPARVVVLGAGGSARAVAWELAATPGTELTIANRHVDRARHVSRWLARHRPRVRVHAASLAGVSLEGVDLLVNATTVGMRATDRCPVDLATLSKDSLVYDLVYHRQTALIRAARRRGCVAAGGQSMLLYQAAESLRLWLKRPPPIAAMRRALQLRLPRAMTNDQIPRSK